MKPTISPEIEAEFLRVPAAAKLCGLSAATLQRLMASGKLKSKCIRQPGAIRGIRLISKQALRDFINSCEESDEDRQKRAEELEKRAAKKKNGGARP